jgi:hypothetical protein
MMCHEVSRAQTGDRRGEGGNRRGRQGGETGAVKQRGAEGERCLRVENQHTTQEKNRDKEGRGERLCSN